MSEETREAARQLFQMRRRLEDISEEMSLAITIEYDLSARLDRAAAEMRRVQRSLETEES
ncbi:MAG: hypothetical protein LUD69_03360 [Oscillospiraceae bacterium]|nr:hypothetical protein [Oscillospiraceae bacterium]MCD8375958.1 hypothetical protein [Oscillospiraceae bacterium]